MGVPRKRIWNSPGASPIVSECESFLAGRYAEHLQSVGRTVPPWAWLNQLSHGSASDIRNLAEGQGGRLDDPGTAAVRFLAGELLVRVDDEAASLAVLQREVLVPEELELANRWMEPLAAGQLVSRVLAKLDRYADTRQRRHGREAA